MRRTGILSMLLLGALALAGCDEPPPCRLCEAVAARNPGTVRALIGQGEPVSQRALEEAADPNWISSRLELESPDARDREIVEVLVQHGDPNTKWTETSRRSRSSTSSGTTTTTYLAAALMQTWGDEQMVALLVRRGLDVRGPAGGEALRQAVIGRRHAAVRALLDAGAPVNHVSVNGDRTTPLAEAIQSRDLALIESLEAAGAVEWVVE